MNATEQRDAELKRHLDALDRQTPRWQQADDDLSLEEQAWIEKQRDAHET